MTAATTTTTTTTTTTAVVTTTTITSTILLLPILLLISILLLLLSCYLRSGGIQFFVSKPVHTGLVEYRVPITHPIHTQISAASSPKPPSMPILS
jgi:hypothetical protein